MDSQAQPSTPPAIGDLPPKSQRSTSLSQTQPHRHGRSRIRHMKRTRSAPDCKHGISSKIKIGLCAMDKKATSKPMCEILARLTAGGEFEVVTFGDKVILEDPVDSWPLCDVLLSWHSEGFPLRKAQAYVELRRPFLVNDVHQQDLLLDRRRVYKTLMENNIPVPRHILVNRDLPPVPEDPVVDIDELTTSSDSAGSSPRAKGARTERPQHMLAQAATRAAAKAAGAPPPAAATGAAARRTSSSGCESSAGCEMVLPDPPGFVEGEDFVELNGVRIDKPFVEKPVSGEDHNIYIYYPFSMGGGVKRLFRKVDNKSADYDPHHPGQVRKDGSYIYEEFLTTGGTDVKVYTVGPRYAHAEARKSPVVDGKVNRTRDGKEVRFPVLLSPQEKEIARMVCLAFGQRVCGFDLLRSETGRSYVCDVNGWSFVKNSKKYYDDAAGILRVMILSQLSPHRLAVAPEAPLPLAGLLEEVAAAQAAADGRDAASTTVEVVQSDADANNNSGCSLCEVEAQVAAAATTDGWEKTPGALVAAEMDQWGPGVMKEVSSLQDLTSLDGTYEEEGMGTDDSSSTGGGNADASRFLELRCVLAVVRHGDRTPKQKMKVTVTQAPLLELFNKYKDSKGKQAKLKSPGQLQELLDVVRALLAGMEVKSSRLSRSGSVASGGVAVEEEKAQELHEEQREKLRIVRTVLEQGGTFSGINRKVQLKPTKWSSPHTVSKPQQQQQQQQQQPSASADAAAGQPQQQHASSSASDKQQGQGQAGGKAAAADGSTLKGARSSSAGGSSGAAVPAASAEAKPQVTELLLILKYGGVLTHAGRSQAEDLGKTFRMVMYPRYGPAGGGLLRLHSTYRHDMKIYSSDEGRVQMSAAAFIKGLLDLEGSSLTPILVSLVTKNASMLDAFGKGASDDILNAKNMLYQHLTWDPERASSLCSKLALPLATPAIGVTPPVSPKSSGMDESMSPFHSRPSQQLLTPLDSVGGNGGSSSLNTPTAVQGARNSFEHSLPTTASCLDLLQHSSKPGGSKKTRGNGGSSSGSASGNEQQQQQQMTLTPRAAGGSFGSLAAAAAANAAGGSGAAAAAAAKLTHSSSWSATRAAEARAAALSGIKAMPDKPLTLLYQLVDLMKVLVDQLREKCLEERLELPANSIQAAAAAAAGGGGGGGSSTLVAVGSSGSNRGTSSNYSSLTTAPDDWRLDENRPCSGERLLLMFDRWRKLLKSFYNEKKLQFDISKVPDIYDSAKYDAIHNSHLQLSSLDELYHISRQLAAVVVPHEYGLDGPGKLLIGSKICAELLGKLMCDLDSMKEESIVTAAIEANTAAARAADVKSGSTGSSRHASRPRTTSHASLLDGTFDAFDTEFGQMSLEDERMRPPRPASLAARLDAAGVGGSHSSAAIAASCGGWAGSSPRPSSRDGSAAAQEGGQQQGQQQNQQQGEGEDEDGGQAEKETLHRLCPTYASDVNSPLRHVRTRIYFTSESHIHSLINVLRYSHLPHLAGANSGLSISKAASDSGAPSPAPGTIGGSDSTAAAAAAAAAKVSVAAAADAAARGGPFVAAVPKDAASATATAPAAAEATAAASTSSLTAEASAAAAGGAGSSSSASIVVAPSGEAVAAAAAADPAGALAVTATLGSWLEGGSQQQQLLTPEGQTLLDNTDEFDYLTHIVFRMYENKMAPVDSPERFFVEIQFSNGANYDPTSVTSPRHTLPTQPRRLLTSPPGVPLQTLQDLVGKYARGKTAPCNYQLQFALRAPGLSQMNSHQMSGASKVPTPGISRAASGTLGPGQGTPPLPPAPAPVVASGGLDRVPTATATALLVAGPGTAPSAPAPLLARVASEAAAAVAAEIAAAAKD